MRAFFQYFRQKPWPAVASGMDAASVGKTTPRSVGEAGAPTVALVPEPPETAGPSKDDELILEFSDFLRTIPPTYLKPEGFDHQTPLRFDLGQIAKSLLHGQSTIPLAEICRRVPDAFQDATLIPDAAEIRFPWQKVVRLLNESAASTEVGKEVLALKLRRRLDAAGEAMRRAAGGQAAARDREKIWFTRKTPQAGQPAGIQPSPSGKRPAPNGQSGEGSVGDSSMEEALSGRLIALDPQRAGTNAGPARAAAPGDEKAPGIASDTGGLDEALQKARDEAAETVRLLQAEHQQEITALNHEKQLALELRDQRIAEVEAEAVARILELQKSFEADRKPIHEPSSPASGGDMSDHESAVDELQARLLAIHSEHESALASLRAETEQVVGEVRAEAERRVAAMQEELEQERTRLAAEKEAGVAALAAGREGLPATGQRESGELKSSLEDTLPGTQPDAFELQQRLATLSAEHEAALATAQQESVRLAEQIREEANARVSELEAEFRAEQAKLGADERQQADALLPQLIAAQAALAAKDSEIAQLKQEHESALQVHHAHVQVAAEREEALAKEKASVEAELERQSAELVTQHENAFASLREELQAEIKRLIASHRRDEEALDQLTLESDVRFGQLEAAAAERVEELTRERERLHSEKESALAALQAELEAVTAENERTLEKLRAAWEEERADLCAEFARERAELQAEKASALEAAFEEHKALAAERDLAAAEYREQIAQLAEKYDHLLATLRQEAEEMVAESARDLAREREILQTQREEAKALAGQESEAVLE